jgi:hypothetical protein
MAASLTAMSPAGPYGSLRLSANLPAPSLTGIAYAQV